MHDSCHVASFHIIFLQNNLFPAMITWIFWGTVVIKLVYKFWLWKETHLHSVNIYAITWIPAMLCWFCCFFSWLERSALKISRWTFKLQPWMNHWKNKGSRREDWNCGGIRNKDMQSRHEKLWMPMQNNYAKCVLVL